MSSASIRVRSRISMRGFALCALIALGSEAIAADTVTTCGQVLEQSATLANDLDCTGMESAVTIRHGATLTLGGFSITGAPIVCDANCAIQGPGTTGSVDGGSIEVSTATVNGDIHASKNVTVVSSTVIGTVFGADMGSVTGSTITGTGASYTTGVAAYLLTMSDSDVTNHSRIGVMCGYCNISNTHIHDNGQTGIACRVLAIENSVLSGNGFTLDTWGPYVSGAIDCTRVRMAGTQVTDNRSGVWAFYSYGLQTKGSVKMTDSLVDGNDLDGVRSKRVAISGSSVTNNGCFGASGFRKLRFETTDITGNGMNPECSAPADHGDVRSLSPPILLDGATCGTSIGDGPARDQSWGVCSLD